LRWGCSITAIEAVHRSFSPQDGIEAANLLNMYIKALYESVAHLITGMDFEDGAKRELQKVVGIKKPKGFPLRGSRTSLASMESLSMPQVCVLA